MQNARLHTTGQQFRLDHVQNAGTSNWIRDRRRDGLHFAVATLPAGGASFR